MRALFLSFVAFTVSAWAGESLTLAAALGRPELRVAISGAETLKVSIENRFATPLAIAQGSGLIFASKTGDDRVITLRAVQFAVPAGQTVEALIPCAALSSAHPLRDTPRQPTTETEPRLAGVLDYLARHDDVPRATAQLLVLCITEDITFGAWRHFLTAAPSDEPPPTEIIAAMDALGLLREIFPQRRFALAADARLKLLALRNPVARGKAMKIYGIALPEAPLPPDLGTLLHTKPGDNCPICRQRALMQPREDGL